MFNFLKRKKHKSDPRVEQINHLIRKMEINLHYFRVEKSRRYYVQIKELYKELPENLISEKKSIASKLEKILKENKEAFSTIPKSEYLTNSWTINLQDFIQPTTGKLMLLLLTFIAANLPNIGIKPTITGNYAFNPLFYPSFLSSPIFSWKVFGSVIFITGSLVYWYLFICLVVFVIKKVKK